MATGFETAFTMDTSSIKFGSGSTKEVSRDMRSQGAARVMVVTDRQVAELPVLSVALESLRRTGIDPVVYDGVRVEPTDISFSEAIEFARDGNFDGYVAVGGGSSIDTAKAANLYATHPAELLAYVNQPIGEGRQIPGPVRPLLAIPTTAGTGSETTGTAIFDLLDLHTKTGIAHRALRPVMGIVDPDNTRSLPPMVAACSGFDVLSHALESYTALPFDRRPAPEHPGARPPYQGSNPISDIWAERSLTAVADSIVRAVTDPEDGGARESMMLAATLAGIGFGNAGVHLPHAMSYPVAGGVREFTPADYDSAHPLVPHGMAVILTAPAVFRFTAPSNPARHLQAARLMGAEIARDSLDDAGEILAERLVELMKATGMPNGLADLGYDIEDIDELVAGTLPQERLTKLSPIPVGPSDLRALFTESMTLW
jgi:hydroxyacid-oxoacid transhydrogenase